MLPLLIGNDNIPKIFVDSHTKRSELRESYQLQASGLACILFSAAQDLRCGNEAWLPVSGKWVRASPAKKRLAAACGKPNALLAPPVGG